MEISRRKFFFSFATAAVLTAVKPGELLSPFEKKLWVPITTPPTTVIRQIIGVAVNPARSGEMLGISLGGSIVSMAFTPEKMQGYYTKVMAGADIVPGSMLHVCGGYVFPVPIVGA